MSNFEINDLDRSSSPDTLLLRPEATGTNEGNIGLKNHKTSNGADSFGLGSIATSLVSHPERPNGLHNSEPIPQSIPVLSTNITIGDSNCANILEISDLPEFNNDGLTMVQRQRIQREIMAMHKDLEECKREILFLDDINLDIFVTQQTYDQEFKFYLREFEHFACCDFSETKNTLSGAHKLKKISSLCDEMLETMEGALDCLTLACESKQFLNNTMARIIEKKCTDILSCDSKNENIFSYCNQQQYPDDTAKLVSNEQVTDFIQHVIFFGCEVLPQRQIHLPDLIIEDSPEAKFQLKDVSRHTFAHLRALIEVKVAPLSVIQNETYPYFRIRHTAFTFEELHLVANILEKDRLSLVQRQLLQRKRIRDNDNNITSDSESGQEPAEKLGTSGKTKTKTMKKL